MSQRESRRWQAITAFATGAAAVCVLASSCLPGRHPPAAGSPAASARGPRTGNAAAAPIPRPPAAPAPGRTPHPGGGPAAASGPAAAGGSASPAAPGGPAPGAAGPTAAARPAWYITRWALAQVAANPSVRAKLARARVYQLVQPGEPALRGASAAPVLHFTSVAGLRKAISHRHLPAGTRTVLYDPEAWRFTPLAEQRHPVQATQRAARLAHAHGLRLIVAPGLDLVIHGPHSALPRWRQFLDRRLAASLAAAADGIELQAQSLERNAGDYAHFVRAAARQARQAKPGITVLAGLSTNPPGAPVASWQLAKATRAAESAVAGYWLNIPGRSAQCPACHDTRVYVGVHMLLEVL